MWLYIFNLLFLQVKFWKNKTKSSMEGNFLTRNTHNKGDRFGFEEHSWPARNYACSFCKREFKSAQALGGHMNVHRRDRARLRSCLTPSSWVSSEFPNKPNPSIEPNPTHLSSSSPSSSCISNNLLNCAHTSPLYIPSLTLSSSLTPASPNGDKKPRRVSPHLLPLLIHQRCEEIKMSKNKASGLGVEEVRGCAIGEELKFFKSSTSEHNIKLELGIGLIKQPEKLDLELRLGHC